MEEDGMRAKSFRYEDYNTRRVFLRSYPLHWGSESEAEESVEAAKWSKEEAAAAAAKRGDGGKKPIKKIILAVVQWGEERIIVLRRFKHRITVYVVNCVPLGPKYLLH